MPFCSSCGKEYQEGSRFCSSCGKRVSCESATSNLATTNESAIEFEENKIWEGKPAGLKARIKGKFNTTTYILTNLRLIIRTGLVRRKEEQIELIRIKDLELIQGLKDRSLGVGDIRIISTDENDPKIVLNDVINPTQVKDLIWKAVREEREKHVRYIGNA